MWHVSLSKRIQIHKGRRSQGQQTAASTMQRKVGEYKGEVFSREEDRTRWRWGTEWCMAAPKYVRHARPTLKGVSNNLCLCKKAKDPDDLHSVRGRFCINTCADSASRPYAFLSYLQTLESVCLYTDVCNKSSLVLEGQVLTAHLTSQIVHCREARWLCPLIKRPPSKVLKVLKSWAG